MTSYPDPAVGREKREPKPDITLRDYPARRRGETIGVRTYWAAGLRPVVARSSDNAPPVDDGGSSKAHARTFTFDELLKSPGRVWMQVGASGAGLLMLVSGAIIAFGSPGVGITVMWLAAAAFCFCNYMTARLGYPTYVVGPAIAGYGVLVFLMLAATAAATAIFD